MQTEPNQLKNTLLGTASVIVVLLVLHVIPEFDYGQFHFKRINLLSDVLVKDQAPPMAVDTAKVIKPVYVDTCKTGITCIEDYSADTTGMKLFMQALDSTKTKKVRIAWFGDSFVEGDIMLDPLRDSLQRIFGGSGVGFMPITSEVNHFRLTILHEYKNWKTYSLVGDQDAAIPLGPAGYAFVPTDKSTLFYGGVAKRRFLNELPSVSLFYTRAKNTTVEYTADTINGSLALNDLNTIGQAEIKGPFKEFTARIKPDSNIIFYGASIESPTGMAVDNFSMRGNSGIKLIGVAEKYFSAFDSIHHYDLVVLSYGLNVANEKAKDYNWYIRGMKKVLPMIKAAFPHSSILLVGCSDRSANVDGEYKTMPMLKELITVQRQLAAENQICFWDMFTAMGGDSTMVRWADMPKHAYANKDYTHLTFYGGKKIADIFIGTLLYEKEKYDRRKKSL